MPTKAKAKKPEVKPVAKKPAVKSPEIAAPLVAKKTPDAEFFKVVVEEKPPVVEMEDFNFGGYVAQAPKGSTPLYSESHPILGLIKAVFQTENAPGDGRVGGAGKQYVWRK